MQYKVKYNNIVLKEAGLNRPADVDHWLRSELCPLQGIRRRSHHTLPQNREEGGAIERA